MAVKVSGTTVIDGSRNIINVGNVDGRDVSVDGAKLDGIEAGATADQTAGEIKTAYESNANTNAFTDAEQTKLAGIEVGADVTDAGNVNPLVDTHLNTSTATTGQYLGWNGADYAWSTVTGYTDADVDTHLNTGTAASGEVLSWNGTDYDWVAVGGSTSVDLTASGSIVAGDPVIINTDGTVSSVSLTGVTTTVGASSVLSGTFENTDVTASAYDAVNDVMVVLASTPFGGGLFSYIVDVSGLTYTKIGSTTTVISNNEPFLVDCVYDPSSGLIIAAYNYDTNNAAGYLFARTGQVDLNAGSITWSPPVALTSSLARLASLSYDPVNEQALLFYSSNTNVSARTLKVISGTLDAGAELIINNDRTTSGAGTYDAENGQLVVSYTDELDGDAAKAAILSINGRTLSVVSGSTITLSSTLVSDQAVESFAGGYTVVYGSKNGPISYLISSDGSSLTLQETNAYSYSSSVSEFKSVYMPSIDKAGFIFLDLESGGNPKLVLLSVSGGTIVQEGPITVQSTSGDEPSVGYDPTENKILCMYQDNSIPVNQADGTITLVTPSSTVTNLKEENFIGFASGTYSDGVTANIYLNGSVNESQLSLTAASKYYVQPDGSLSTSAGIPSVYAGIAVSPTKLIVKG